MSPANEDPEGGTPRPPTKVEAASHAQKELSPLPPPADGEEMRKDAPHATGTDDDGPADPKPGAAERILASARTLFCERGYEGVSMRDIALHAGARKASVFYHFASKEALFEKVLDGYYAAQMQRMSGALTRLMADPQRSPRTMAHGLLDSYLDFVEEHRAWPRLVQSILASQGEQLELLRRSIEPLAQWTQVAMSELLPKTGPHSARHFFVTFTSAIVDYFTLAPSLPIFWPADPFAPEALAERRAHLHTMVDLVIGSIERGELSVTPG